jgi:hypothetical protein
VTLASALPVGAENPDYAVAGVIGFVGEEIAAQLRVRGGRRLSSPHSSPTE